MNLIDTHAHLTWDSFATDFEAVIQRSLQAGVTSVINVGADLESSQKALRLAQGKQLSQGKQPKSGISFFSSIGLHPHEVSKFSTDESIHQNVGELEQIYQNNTGKIVAVGECGLDYHFQNNPDFSSSLLSLEQLIASQKQLFQAQISLAKKLSLPLIIHCREAWEDIFVGQLKGTSGVFHSFTGNSNNAQQVLDLGYHLGLSCIVTYPKNEHLREIIKNAPLEKLLTETDCPYLPPQTQRGQRNEPANVLEVVKVVALMKNLSLEKTAHQLRQNACKLFNLPSDA